MVSVPTETQTIKKPHVSFQRTEQCYLCSGSICPSQLAHRRLSKTSLLTRQRRKNTETENPKVKRAILPSVWFMVRGTRNSDDHPAVVLPGMKSADLMLAIQNKTPFCSQSWTALLVSFLLREPWAGSGGRHRSDSSHLVRRPRESGFLMTSVSEPSWGFNPAVTHLGNYEQEAQS